MRLEDILPELRKGRKAKRIHWREITKQRYFEVEDVMADDWELVPEPVRVADYLVQGGTADGAPAPVWFKEAHPIGQQPEGAVLVPGSEREATQ